MNKKIVILLILLISFCSVDSFAQGLFSGGDVNSSDSEETPSSSIFDKGSLTRGRGDETPDPGEKPSPIGEGLLILTVLAGGYSLVRNRKDKR